MPHQQHIMDVATEIDPVTGGLWYRELGFGVPRQSGKTTMQLPKFVWRAEAAHLLGGRQRMLYAAQTKADAFDKFDEDFIEDLAAAKVMRGRYRVTNNQGRKRIRFQSGSILSPVATTTKSGHGKTLDDGTLDEAWAQVDNRVEAAWRPAMITRPQAQLWITSTAGTAASVYWRAKVLHGRAAAEAKDPSSRLAYFEWSMDPALDPYNSENWWTCMPALGFTITEDAIRHELETIEGGLPEFRRAYLNQWVDEVAAQKLPAASWLACRDPGSQIVGLPVFAVEVSHDRSLAVIVAAGVRADQLPHVEVVKYQPGTDWVLPWLVARRDVCRCVVVDRQGPAGSLLPELVQQSGLRLTIAGTRDLAQGCGALFDAVVTEQLRHLGQVQLDAAVAGAEVRQTGDVWLWDLKGSPLDISPLRAATLALWGLSGQLVLDGDLMA
jgi:hypothetical protein